MPKPDLNDWRKFVDRVISPSKRVKIAVVGKYMDVRDAYKSIYESLTHAAASEDCGIDLKLVDAESLADRVAGDQLEDVAGVLIPGGFGFAERKGKLMRRVMLASTESPFLVCVWACKWRQLNSPGTYCGIKDANSTEFDKENPDPVVSLLEEQHAVRNRGASMRLRNLADKNCSGNAGRKEFYGRH